MLIEAAMANPAGESSGAAVVALSPPTPSAFGYMLWPTIPGNFPRTLATPGPVKDWPLTSLNERLIKTGAKAVSHGRYAAFQMAGAAISRHLFGDILRLDRGTAAASGSRIGVKRSIVLRPIKNQGRGAS